jgi:hypothetical protein
LTGSIVPVIVAQLMAVETPSAPTVGQPPAEPTEAGVIKDARARQRRQRHLLALCGVLLVVGAGLVVYAARAGGDSSRVTVPSPGAVTGSLRPLPPSAFQLWVTPSLVPGGPSLDVSVRFAPRGGWSWVGCCNDYPGPSLPIAPLGPVVRTSLAYSAGYVLIVGSAVAAVRVGGLGTVGAETVSGLPSGDKIVAFSVPRGANPKPVTITPVVVTTALDRSGQPIPSPLVRPGSAPPVKYWTAHGGRCAVTSGLPGLSAERTLALTTITRVPAGTPGPFLSCLDDRYSYKGAEFNVALLLDAHRPGQSPPPLWGARPLPGHPAIAEIAPPTFFARNENIGAPLYARRVGNAWLVVQARPGFARNPRLSERIRVLDSIRVTRIDGSHG